MKKIYITQTPEETERLGIEIGKKAVKGDVIAITGELGSGKTALTRGIAEGMGITEDITSPTFSLMEIHEGDIILYHFDLYRIEDDREFNNLCFEEYWENEGISVIEWAERAENRLPDKRIDISIEYTSSTERRITVEYPDN
ncbi:MAG TPA: tRNA (adenosine(37)-N6)-threonylcarbamoyltransferase complex ATPase subunit type 1 TsaE [Spirochaetota bacterium]|nr:tRNA (adenosine(37)-N6)-threonylcarbamoyltransferase complex ATPase subunit type 1 TsaE [Spirochaetota bacterium]HPF06032.1 tRNA (adenosine(37)-N6)-threonylcarbamoyltransferase complex ATPase subunit type 1 TsaE [Spirochaetota bacterium]HPJ41818.1 tRNA (adenosine(37)-N6)-threonylcarbamoyltransferase complex ATPase subunit type 1 TsaE [Spirochaetota bacterium]HPR36785.1 tRNA (adenosine(37)-N6)-threonylcarbamoyltransferase complex ATPase subunit type 1 TsaE [Spirochaetota bacterium]HRX46324.1 